MSTPRPGNDSASPLLLGRLPLFAAILVAALVAAPSARAQAYPNRPIKLVVAVLPGGPMDVMGRLIAQHLSSTLGQVFVENRAGAGTTLGAKAVASAEPDGYTLLLGNAATLAIGPTLYKSAGYDPRTSFAPVAFLASAPYVLIVSPSVPVRTVSELLAYAKAHPGKLSFGVPNAAPPHMLAAWFKALTGTDVVIVPYKGASAVLTDLLGGQIQAGFETTSVLLGHLQDKKINALAVATPARLSDLPNVPTMIESGFPDFVASSWTSVMAPAGTPKDIVGKLNESINTGLNSPQMQCPLQTARRRCTTRNAGRACGLRRKRNSEMAGDGETRRCHRRVIRDGVPAGPFSNRDEVNEAPNGAPRAYSNRIVGARDGGGEVRVSESAPAAATKLPSNTITSRPAASRWRPSAARVL
jgi:tripartite-type tricarboxylate transporter receptor subunit TctC